MAQLKKSIIERIYRELDNIYFTPIDFLVEFPKSSNTYAVIKFRQNPSYCFKIFETTIRTSNPRDILSPKYKSSPATLESPGDFKNNEEITHDSYDKCLDRISVWCGNIRSELLSKEVVTPELEDIRNQLDADISEHLSDPDSNFSDDEIENLKTRFDQLFKQFEQLAKQHQLTENELQKIKKDFDIIKQTAAEYPKGVWADLAKNRIVSMLGKVASSKEAKTLMVAGAKKLLGLE